MFAKIKKRIELIKHADIYERLYDKTYNEYFWYQQAVLSMLADKSLTSEQYNEIKRRFKEMYKSAQDRSRV